MTVSLVPHQPCAVVVGGSIAGMCAARVLSEGGFDVTIVESDPLTETPVGRRGVPQSPQPHGVLLRGRTELDRLFPGLLSELRRRGAHELDPGYDYVRYTEWGWGKRFRGNQSVLACTRPLVETTLRERFIKCSPRVRWLEKTRVEGLVVKEGTRRVSGVRLRGSDADSQVLHADLVVDASGRASRSDAWFEALNLPKPEEQVIDSRATYVTRMYKAPPREKLPQGFWWRGAMVDPIVPEIPRWGMLTPVEGGRWLVTAGGVSNVRAPLDPEGFVDYLRNLRTPLLAQMIEHAEPISDIAQSRSTHCRWRRFDKWQGGLRGFLSVGDAVAGFNPTYGQGITSATMQAVLLEQHLRDYRLDHPKFETQYFKAQAKFLNPMWDFAAGLDLRWPATIGPRPFYASAQRWATRLIERAAQEDPQILRDILQVVELVAPQWSLLRPSFVARVWRSLFRLTFRGPSLHTDPSPPARFALSAGPVVSEHEQADFTRPMNI